MKLLNKIHLLLLILITNCGICQNLVLEAINLEELNICRTNVVQNIYSVNNNEYYRYIDKRAITSELGQPDEVQTRDDDLMETKIIRMRYDNSYIELFDHSFGEGLDQNQYSLFSIDFNDAKIWLEYKGETLKVGEEAPIFYKQVNDRNEAIVKLRRGTLDQISDYVLKIKFKEEKVSNIIAAFD